MNLQKKSFVGKKEEKENIMKTTVIAAALTLAVAAAEPNQITLPTVFAHGMGDSCFNPGVSYFVLSCSHF